MQRDVLELVYGIVSDERKVVDGEPNRWRNRWWKMRIALGARRIMKLILKQKKSAGIAYPKEMSLVPLTMSWLMGNMLWWERDKGSEGFVTLLHYSKDGVRVVQSNSPGVMTPYADFWARYADVWFSRLYRRMTEARQRQFAAMARALKKTANDIETMMPNVAADVWAKMAAEEQEKMRGAVV